jgi:hypothetical protein
VDTIALALDSTGSVVLAGMISSQQLSLSADSTATALVRLLLATGAETATAAQENAAIQSAPGYGSFVSLISSDLQNNVRPFGDPQVVAQLFSVAASAISALPTSQASPARIKDQVGPPPISGYTQYTVIDGVLQANLFVKPTQGAKTIEIDNLMPMPWTAQSEAADPNGPGAPLGAPQVVPAVGLVLAGTATLPMSNSPFNLYIYDNDSDSLQRIAKSFLGNLLASSIDVIVSSRTPAGESCQANVAAALGKLSLPTITDDGSFLTTLEKGLTDVIKPPSLQPLFQSCGAQLGVTFAVLYTAIKQVYLQDLLEFVEGVGEGSLAVGANDIVAEAYYANKYWDKSYTIGICAAADYSIQSCVASFSFSPNQLLMAPGTQQSVAVTGVDSNGQNTAIPGDLQNNSEDETVATVTGNSSFTVTAVAPGSTSIDMLDPSTGATSTESPTNPFQVTVALPTLSPSATAFAVSGVDQTLTVSLKGPNGEPPCGIAPVEPCINLPSGITWQPSSATSMESPATVIGSSATWTIPANAPAGQFSISASDANGNSYGTVTITLASGGSGGSTGSCPDINACLGKEVVFQTVVTVTSDCPNIPGVPYPQSGTSTDTNQLMIGSDGSYEFSVLDMEGYSATPGYPLVLPYVYDVIYNGPDGGAAAATGSFTWSTSGVNGQETVEWYTGDMTTCTSTANVVSTVIEVCTPYSC